MDLEFPNLPYLLVDDGFTLTEHMAIHQYCADKWNPELLGQNEEEKTRVDMLAGVLSALKQSLHLQCYVEKDKQEIGKQAVIDVKQVASFIKGKEFLLGKNVCYLDFYLFEMIQLVEFLTEGQVFEVFPDFEKYQMRMASLPKLKDYLESGRALVAPFNMKFALVNNWSPTYEELSGSNQGSFYA